MSSDSTSLNPAEKPLSLSLWLCQAQSRLHQAGVEAPRESAFLLAGYGLNLTRAALLSQPDQHLSQSENMHLEGLLQRRLRHEPIAYILGFKGFRDRTFSVNGSVLVPRPETEELIDLIGACELKPESILDAGSGTGCLAICLADLFPGANVFACDLSSEALQCACSNDPGRCIKWIKCDWLTCFRPSSFDLIVSNPPYLTGDEVSQTNPQVRNHEPRLALDGGVDGCEAFRKVIPQAYEALTPGGFLFLEGSPTVGQTVLELLSSSGFHSVRKYYDLSGKERFFLGRK